jgi:hypothetical protein
LTCLRPPFRLPPSCSPTSTPLNSSVLPSAFARAYQSACWHYVDLSVSKHPNRTAVPTFWQRWSRHIAQPYKRVVSKSNCSFNCASSKLWTLFLLT